MNEPKQPEQPAQKLPLPPGIKFKKYKGQVLFNNGQAAELKLEALDHISAMIKLAASLSDNPIAVKQWWIAEDEGTIIQAPFAPAIVPRK